MTLGILSSLFSSLSDAAKEKKQEMQNTMEKAQRMDAKSLVNRLSLGGLSFQERLTYTKVLQQKAFSLSHNDLIDIYDCYSRKNHLNADIIRGLTEEMLRRGYLEQGDDGRYRRTYH